MISPRENQPEPDYVELIKSYPESKLKDDFEGKKIDKSKCDDCPEWNRGFSLLSNDLRRFLLVRERL